MKSAFYNDVFTPASKRHIKSGYQGQCPECGKPVFAKKGYIKNPHWCHLSGSECRPEPESEWHKSWKRLVKPGFREKIVKKNGILRRADIFIGEWAIELQHSHLPPEIVELREEFYGSIIWIVDASGFHHRLKFTKREKPRKGDSGHYFTWSHPRLWQTYIKKNLFWDPGPDSTWGKDKLFLVRTFNCDLDLSWNKDPKLSQYRGWGYFCNKTDILKNCIGPSRLQDEKKWKRQILKFSHPGRTRMFRLSQKDYIEEEKTGIKKYI